MADANAAMIAGILAQKSALRAAQSNDGDPLREGDYKIDDIVFCGVCNKPRQKRLNVYGNPIVWTLCECEKAKRDVEDAERERAERQKNVNALLSRLSAYNLIDDDPPPEMIHNEDGTTTFRPKHNHTFADDDGQNPEATKYAKDYADKFDELRKQGEGIVFYGNVGSGKTWLADCIIADLKDKGYAAASTSFSRIDNALWSITARQEAIDLLTCLDVLSIDDLFAERATEYMTDNTRKIIDALYTAKVPVIITTNLTREQLADDRNLPRQRVFSRLYEMCRFCLVNTPDRRRNLSRKRKQS